MERILYIGSSLVAGAMTTQTFFKKTLKVRESSALPAVGFPVRPGCLVDNYGQLEEGVVFHADTRNKSQILGILFPALPKKLGEVFTSSKGYTEVSGLGQ